MSAADTNIQPGDSQQRIAELEARLAAAEAQLEADRFASEIGGALIAASTAGLLYCPVAADTLLKMIVDTAAEVLSANAASLLLIDAAKTSLIFEVATGPTAGEIKKVKVPIGHGIAGYVAASGQPMAVADAQHSSAHATDIADRVGYYPSTILCVPLFYRDMVTGVLEVMDKHSGETFDQNDIQTLSAFANQAAVAIELSRGSDNLARLTTGLLQAVHGDSDRAALGAQARIETLATSFAGDPAYRQALEMASHIHRIAGAGPKSAQACLTVLAAFADLGAQPRSFGR